MRFKRLQPGYYFTDKPVESLGQHVVLEQIKNGWLLRLVEGREISRHTTKKAAIYALQMLAEGIDVR